MESGRAAYLQNGLAAAICGASWKAPIDSCSANEAPPRRTMGQQLDQAFARPAMPWIWPGPETARHAPGTPVRKPTHAAA